MQALRFKSSRAHLAIYSALCLAINLFPFYGQPSFRYTGSDPAYHVWNLGWPVPLVILDDRYGLQVGPFAYAVIPLQVVVPVAVIVVSALIRRLKSSSAEPSAEITS